MQTENKNYMTTFIERNKETLLESLPTSSSVELSDKMMNEEPTLLNPGDNHSEYTLSDDSFYNERPKTIVLDDLEYRARISEKERRQRIKEERLQFEATQKERIQLFQQHIQAQQSSREVAFQLKAKLIQEKLKQKQAKQTFQSMFNDSIINRLPTSIRLLGEMKALDDKSQSKFSFENISPISSSTAAESPVQTTDKTNKWLWSDFNMFVRLYQNKFTAAEREVFKTMSETQDIEHPENIQSPQDVDLRKLKSLSASFVELSPSQILKLESAKNLGLADSTTNDDSKTDLKSGIEGLKEKKDSILKEPVHEVLASVFTAPSSSSAAAETKLVTKMSILKEPSSSSNTDNKLKKKVSIVETFNRDSSSSDILKSDSEKDLLFKSKETEKVQSAEDAPKSLVPDEQISKTLVPDKQIDKVLVPDKQIDKVLVPDKQIDKVLVPDKQIDKVLVPDKQIDKVLVPDKQIDKVLVPDKQIDKVLVPDKQIDKVLVPDKQIDKVLAPDEQLSKPLATDEEIKKITELLEKESSLKVVPEKTSQGLKATELSKKVVKEVSPIKEKLKLFEKPKEDSTLIKTVKEPTLKAELPKSPVPKVIRKAIAKTYKDSCTEVESNKLSTETLKEPIKKKNIWEKIVNKTQQNILTEKTAMKKFVNEYLEEPHAKIVHSKLSEQDLRSNNVSKSSVIGPESNFEAEPAKRETILSNSLEDRKSAPISKVARISATETEKPKPKNSVLDRIKNTALLKTEPVHKKSAAQAMAAKFDAKIAALHSKEKPLSGNVVSSVAAKFNEKIASQSRRSVLKKLPSDKFSKEGTKVASGSRVLAAKKSFESASSNPKPLTSINVKQAKPSFLAKNILSKPSLEKVTAKIPPKAVSKPSESVKSNLGAKKEAAPAKSPADEWAIHPIRVRALESLDKDKDFQELVMLRKFVNILVDSEMKADTVEFISGDKEPVTCKAAKDIKTITLKPTAGIVKEINLCRLSGAYSWNDLSSTPKLQTFFKLRGIRETLAENQPFIILIEFQNERKYMQRHCLQLSNEWPTFDDFTQGQTFAKFLMFIKKLIPQD